MQRFLEAFHQLDRCLFERMRAYNTPALVMALTDRHKTIRVSAFGKANLETSEPIREDHLFAIGSIGKAFTAIAVLQAYEAGLIDLHAPVKEYLPWFEVKSQFPPISVHHLLTHSSGLPRGTDFSPDPRAELYALRELETGFAPGAHFCYSDIGYKLLGVLLEAVTGKSYAALIQEKILTPLEMWDTSAQTVSSLRPRMASGYRYLYDDRPYQKSHPLVPAAWVETNSGDGCIVSTAEDMARFARMLLNQGQGPHEPLLSESSYRKMIQPMIEDEGEMYGYGLYLFEDDGYHIAGHGGDVPGYESYMWLDIDNGLGSIVLMTQPYTPRASFITLEFFRAAYLSHPLPDPPPLPDFTHLKDPNPYAGVYRSRDCTLTFEAAGHHLFLVTGGQRVVLEERANDRFFADTPDWDLFPFQFGRNEAGEVVEVCYGPRWLINDRYQGQTKFDSPPEWARFEGHYRSHDPWDTNFRVFQRKGQLIFCSPDGDEEVLVPLGGNCFRIGEEEYIPERLTFDQVVDGKALRAVRSGCPYYRFFTP